MIFLMTSSWLTGQPGISQDSSNNGKMRGWEIHEYGGINSLKFSHSINIPAITSPNEVLIEVHTSSVNPLDYLMTGKSK